MTELTMLRAETLETQLYQRSHTRPVLVQFTANWCGPCRLQKPLLQKLAQTHAQHMDVLLADVVECAELARVCSVQGVPQLRLFVDGAVVMRAEGLIPEANLLLRLQAWLPVP